MKATHWQWAEENMHYINLALEIDFYLDTKEDEQYFEECVDIYDTEEDFERNVGDFIGKEEAGYAVHVAGKYLFLNEANL